MNHQFQLGCSIGEKVDFSIIIQVIHQMSSNQSISKALFSPCLDIIVAREMVDYQKVLLKKRLGVEIMSRKGRDHRNNMITILAKNQPHSTREEIISLLDRLNRSEIIYDQLSQEHSDFSRTPECMCFMNY